MQILLGADPEIFVADAKDPTNFQNALGIVTGSKEEPEPCEHGAMQLDGMALEFNIDPAASEDEFVHNIESVMGQLRQRLPSGLHLSGECVAVFNQDYFNRQPESCKELGCEPDFNAWSGGENPRPDGSRNMRTAAGHIHVGWGNNFDPGSGAHRAICEQFVRNLDFSLGAASLLWDPDIGPRS